MSRESAWVDICPKCGAPSVTSRTHDGHGRRPDSEHRYRCGACTARFDEPDRRPNKKLNPALRSLMVETGADGGNRR